MFCNLNLTDMETCYKVFRTDLLKSIPIRSDRFGFEPEIVMKSAKRKFRIYEVPISYHGRTYEEGKKIGWRDGLKALGVILKFWLIDDLYAAPYGRGVLNNLTGTPQYLSWLARKLRPHVGDTVLEVGAGIGNLAGRLMARRLLYVAAEKDPLHLHALRNRFLRTPNVVVQRIDPEVAGRSGGPGKLLRHGALPECAGVPGRSGGGAALAARHAQARRRAGGAGAATGRACSAASTAAWATSAALSRASAGSCSRARAFRWRRRTSFNKAGAPPWWAYSKLFGCGRHQQAGAEDLR